MARLERDIALRRALVEACAEVGLSVRHEEGRLFGRIVDTESREVAARFETDGWTLLASHQERFAERLLVVSAALDGVRSSLGCS